MIYTPEVEQEVLRIARENLRWEPNEDQVSLIIALADTSAHLAFQVGKAYRKRFEKVAV